MTLNKGELHLRWKPKDSSNVRSEPEKIEANTEKSQRFLCLSSSISTDNGAIGPVLLQAEAGLSQLKNQAKQRMGWKCTFVSTIRIVSTIKISQTKPWLQLGYWGRVPVAPGRFEVSVPWLLGWELSLELWLRGASCDSQWQSEMRVTSFFMHKSHIYLWQPSLPGQISTAGKMNSAVRTVKAVVFPLSHSFKAEDANMATSTTALALGSGRVKLLKASHI